MACSPRMPVNAFALPAFVMTARAAPLAMPWRERWTGAEAVLLVVKHPAKTDLAVVDNFGIETILYSQATRTVENVNNRPSGRIIIRRVGE